MKKYTFLLATVAMLSAFSASARDTILTLPLDEIIGTETANSALLPVPVYFAGQDHPEVVRSGGEVTTSRRTNSFNKTDDEACQWVLLSALKVLQDAAQRRGYDAVVNIRSNYNHNEFGSATEYQCAAGRIMAGVALKGDLAKF